MKLFFSSHPLILPQQVTAQLPPTFCSGQFAKQNASAVSMELVQLLLQQLLPLQQQQLVKNAERFFK